MEYRIRCRRRMSSILMLLASVYPDDVDKDSLLIPCAGLSVTNHCRGLPGS